MGTCTVFVPFTTLGPEGQVDQEPAGLSADSSVNVWALAGQ